MANMMAIVSKAVFETEAGKDPSVGTQLKMDRYTSGNKQLEALAGGGKLYLVTVRPPDEKLWLVAILDKPKFNNKAWVAKPSTIPITDISALKKKIKFESGKGISAAKGALGMSLQTPRELTDADCKLLDEAAGAGAAIETGAKKGKFDKSLPPAKSGVAPASDRKTALLQAVIADPSNMDARRVYADELSTHNDPRGEFILVDLALAGRLSIRKREALVERANELRKKYAKQWWPYKGTLHTHAGFVESVEGPFGVVASTAGKLLENEPASDLRVSVVKDDLDTLAKCWWADQIKRLSLRGKIGDGGFVEVVNNPRLENLEALNVTGAGIEKLQIDKLTKLTSLCLTANSIGGAGIGNLVKWKGLANLERLLLGDCDLSNADVDKLLAVKMPKLVHLSLAKNTDLDGKIGGVIAGHAKNLPALAHLELNGSRINGSGVTALLKAKLPALAKLDVRRTDVEDDEATDARVVV